MKRISIAALVILLVAGNLSAQEKEKEHGKLRKAESSGFFTGGNLVTTFLNDNYAAGINPMIGYRVASILDLGIYANYTYLTMPRFSPIYTYHQNILGGGGFLRFYPVPYLFARASSEYNQVHTNFISRANRNDFTKGQFSTSSLFAGFGYAHNRLRFANKPFFSLALLWDVTTGSESPYKDNKSKAFPIIKFGYTWPLGKQD